MPNSRYALLIGTQAQLLHPLPNLLSRAGFTVDLMTSSFGVIRQKSIRHLVIFKTFSELLNALSKIDLNIYSLVVSSDDDTLTAIQMSNLSEKKKIKLLPIVAMTNATHLHSKIALSQILRSHGIATPNFAIAQNPDELQLKTIKMGFPAMIKIDQSGGGFGVYSCENTDQLKHLCNQKLTYPLLVQKKVDGKMVDLSGFYQNGRLIHFTYSEFKKCIRGPYGPSVLRTYYDSADLPFQIKDELVKIGKVLGIDGFTNLSCLMSANREQRNYIEVDLRPTIWCDYGKYLGDDPAVAIKAYFDTGISDVSLIQPSPILKQQQPPLQIAHYLRINLFELLVNRYGVWRYLNGASLAVLAQQYLLRQPIDRAEYCLTRIIKTKLSPNLWDTLRSNYLNLKSRIL